MKTVYILAMLLILSTLSCTSCTEPEESTKTQEIEQQLLMEGLKNEGLPFRVSPDGVIWYAVSLRERVGAIQARVMDRTSPLYAHSFAYADEAISFAQFLEQKGIHTRQWNDLGQHWVQWAESDDQLVDKAEFELLRQKAKQEFSK